MKKPVKVTFRPLAEALDSPGEMMLSDFAKFDRPQVLHAAFRGLSKYTDEKGAVAPGDVKAAAEVVAYANDFFDGDLDEAQSKVRTGVLEIRRTTATGETRSKSRTRY